MSVMTCDVCGRPCNSKYSVCEGTPECARERKRRRNGTAETRARAREYRRENREHIQALHKSWRQDNAERLRARAAERYEAGRDKSLEYGNDYRRALRSTVEGTARLMFLGARARARKYSLPFDLTTEWVAAELALALENGCPLLGIEIVLSTGRRGSRSSPGTPSIDRFRPELGYVRANCWIVSWAANEIKRDLTLDFVRTVVGMADSRFKGAA